MNVQAHEGETMNETTKALREVLAQIGTVEAMRKKSAAVSNQREWFLSHNHARELAYHLLRDHGDAILAALTGSEGAGLKVASEIREFVDQEAEPSFDMLVSWAERLEADAARQSQPGQEVGNG